MFFNQLETERLIIREFEESDFESVHLYASKPEVTKYMPFGPNSKDETRLFLKNAIGYKHQSPRKNYDLAVVLKKDDVLIGGCGIYITNISVKEGYIGHCLDNVYWGNGYATEAANALLKFGFEILKLHRIFATCHTKNTASAKVLEKSGMIKEGCLRDNRFHQGKWMDSFIFSILEHEYIASSQ